MRSALYRPPTTVSAARSVLAVSALSSCVLVLVHLLSLLYLPSSNGKFWIISSCHTLCYTSSSTWTTAVLTSLLPSSKYTTDVDLLVTIGILFLKYNIHFITNWLYMCLFINLSEIFWHKLIIYFFIFINLLNNSYS